MKTWMWIVVVFFAFFSSCYLFYRYLNRQQQLNLTFKSCTVTFNYRFSIDTASDQYYSAKRKLGLCLCEAYLKKANLPTAKQILVLYKHYGYLLHQDSINYKPHTNLDTILKYRTQVFDPVILWD